MNDLDNYRAVTLIPIVSKVFESLVLALFDDVFVVDDFQFGFKRGVGCTVFALKTVVSYFNKMDIFVFLASLDIRKAFDSLHHDKLFKCLYKIGLRLPESLVEKLCNWYGKLFVSVR